MKQNVKRIVQTALMSACFMAGFAQSTITGTVKDNNGDPLIGASVVINGHQKEPLPIWTDISPYQMSQTMLKSELAMLATKIAS